MAQLVDHRGDPIDMAALREERGGATVSGVRSVFPSIPSRIPRPEIMAAILREAETPGDGSTERYVDLAELMLERDPHFMGVLQTRQRGVSQLPLTVEPASDAAADVRDAELVDEFFKREDVEDELFDVLDSIGKGYSVTEIIWETSERQWMPVRLEYQLPRWYGFDRETGRRVLRRGEGGVVEPLEPYKFIVHTSAAKSGLPIRGGLARIAAWTWLFKAFTTQDWVRFVEVYGQPIRIGRHAVGASKDDKRTLYRAVSNIASDAAALLPVGMDIEFIADSIARRSDVYRDLLHYLDAQVAIAVLGQTLTTQPGDSGSYGLGKVHQMVREDIRRSDSRQLASTLRRDLAIPVVQLNEGPRRAYPHIVIDYKDPADKDALSGALERLLPFGLRVRADEVRTVLGLSAPGADDEVLAAPAPGSGSTDPPAAPPARARDAGGHDLTRAHARTVDESDPLPALTARTRATLGPLVDAWAADVRRDLEDAGSLGDVRARLDTLLAWTRSPAAPTPDVAGAAAALQPALAAAHLAGRFDVAEEAGAGETTRALATDAGACIALATASVSHTRLPFAEQIEFFRSKLDLPTRAWTDIWQDEHDRAFVVAGAAHADLVADLRGAVDKAIADGTTLATFRKDFDSIVAKHGWSYNGGRDWRTRVIYSTNLRTSYAAGRYQQMKDVAEHRPFWRYRHSHASKDPRHDHLAWDGLILRHDDPWFDTHYPPGGWGCKCYIETLAERDLKRLGKDGPDAAPAVRTRTVTVGAKGPSPRTVTVPVGIDPGWAYAPGKSVLKRPPTPTDPFTVPELSRADATAHRVGAQAGSNPGGLYRGTDGKLRYVKYYDDAAQSYGEAVANNAYRALGLDAPASALVRDGAAIVGIANEYIDHAGALGGAKRLAKGRARKVLDGYAADVWLANWDAVGLNLDNVVATRAARNAVARIDQGGALLMRARRGRKPAGVLDQITEWEGFGNPQRNPAYVRVLRAAGVESGDALGRAALKQIAAIEALGKRTRDFRDLAPTVRGVADADQAAILAALRTRARLLKRQIDPRVRKAMAMARNPQAYQARTQADMGQWYDKALRRGERKIEAGAPRRDMTNPELVTTYAYTTEQPVWSHYRLLNDALRDAKPGGPPLPRRIDDYRRTLNDALDKLPDEQGTFWRGVDLSGTEQAEYVPGRIVTWGAFSSATRRQDRAFPRNTLFTIHGRHGKDIHRYSEFPREAEVLFKSGTRTRVVKKRRDAAGVMQIELMEVDDG